jgi:F0F1-type ATP synthase assembly protein I
MRINLSRYEVTLPYERQYEIIALLVQLYIFVWVCFMFYYWAVPLVGVSRGLKMFTLPLGNVYFKVFAFISWRSHSHNPLEKCVGCIPVCAES